MLMQHYIIQLLKRLRDDPHGKGDMHAFDATHTSRESHYEVIALALKSKVITVMNFGFIRITQAGRELLTANERVHDFAKELKPGMHIRLRHFHRSIKLPILKVISDRQFPLPDDTGTPPVDPSPCIVIYSDPSIDPKADYWPIAVFDPRAVTILPN
jgi:hypothetical protein